MATLNIDRPFTTAQAHAVAITPAMLRGTRFRRVFRGVYVAVRVPFHPLIQTAGALLTHPEAAFASHHSAARVYRLPVPDCVDEHVSVFSKSDRRRRDGIVAHTAVEQEVVLVQGIRVSTPVHLFLDMAAVLNLVDLVVLGDAMVRRKLVTPAMLVEACAAWGGLGRRQARRAASYVRARVDSPMESRLRMLIVLAGLPEPEVNRKLYDESGHELFRLDLSYPALKIDIEYDGQQHRDELPQWDHDIDRASWLDRHGWKVVPVSSKGIYRRPDQTIDRVLAALRERRCPGLPARLSDEWRSSFPVK